MRHGFSVAPAAVRASGSPGVEALMDASGFVRMSMSRVSVCVFLLIPFPVLGPCGAPRAIAMSATRMRHCTRWSAPDRRGR